MLVFYSIMIFGVFFVSLVIAEVGRLGLMLEETLFVLEEVLDRSMIFAILGLASLTSVLAGYFGRGPAELLIETDEYVILPAPVKPFQIFFSKYIHRVIRKSSIIIIITFAFLPILSSLNFLIGPMIILLLSFIIFSEVNFFLGGISAYIRIKVEQKTRSRLRYLLLVIIGIVVYLPTTPQFSSNPISHLLVPSNALSMIIIETTGLLAMGYQIEVGIICLTYAFLICLLVLAILCNYDYYDEFAKIAGKEDSSGAYSSLIRKDVEFSDSRFKDPMVWVMMKDFWSKLRTPLQFWKYVYIVIGTLFAIYLNLVQPVWLTPILIPPEISYAAVPAFLLLLLLLTQMTTITSLLSFVEEKENVYLLKVSPFRDRDIVIGKYLLSVIEIGLAALPVYGLIVYIFNVRGSIFLVTLAAPLILIFSASGIMVGAYIPVFTNDPRTPPVPLAFAFPSINLSIGGLLIAIVSVFAKSPYLLIILPSITVGLVTLFLGLAVIALEHYR
jgi:hypothetical protein